MESSIGMADRASNRDLLIAESEEQGVFFDLVRAASRLEGELNRALRPFDLTTATYSILSILERAGNEGLSCGDVAEQLIAEVPDMTRLLDRLERLEYVTRERSAHDRRMVKVKLTERGVEVVRSLKEVVKECHKTQFKTLATEQLQALRYGLRDVLRAERGESLSKDHEARGAGGHLAIR